LTRDFWRISSYNSLSGDGGLLYAARWHSAGRRIVYFAESAAGAMLEALVHLELNVKDWPLIYSLMQVSAPADLQIESLPVPTHVDWRRSPLMTRSIGDAWLQSRQTALARVPSAVLPDTWNVLLNPQHPDADQVAIIKVTRAEYDSRLFMQDS
jgi:RES domain-containing protein